MKEVNSLTTSAVAAARALMSIPAFWPSKEFAIGKGAAQ